MPQVGSMPIEQDEDEKAREKYEEENFVRLQRTKKEKKKLREKHREQGWDVRTFSLLYL